MRRHVIGTAAPPLQADERTALIGWLDLQRQILRWKYKGLNDEHGASHSARSSVRGRPSVCQSALSRDSSNAGCARGNETVAAGALDDIGRHPDFRYGGANLP